MKPFNVASVRPQIVDPETINIIVDTDFRYNALATTKTASDLQTEVNTTITNYSENNLEKFDNMFRYSELSRLIDNTDTSILSNITTVRMYKEVTPQLNTLTQYTVKFYNQFFNPHSEPMVLFYRLLVSKFLVQLLNSSWMMMVEVMLESLKLSLTKKFMQTQR